MPTLVHCGYHKCLTVYTDRCFRHVLGDRFQSFFGKLDLFYAEHRRLAHAQELIATVSECAEALDESDSAAANVLAHASARLAAAAALDPSLEDVRREAEAAAVQAREAAQQLRRYLQRLEVDPGRLGQLDARLKAVIDSARKYRVDPAELPAALAERRARLAELGGEESLEALRAQEAANEKAFREVAAKLSQLRREAARRLGTEVTTTMQRLAMAGVAVGNQVHRARIRLGTRTRLRPVP